MTRSVEERLRSALDEAGTAVAGAVEVPEWEWLSLPTLSPDPGAEAPVPRSPRRRGRRFDRRVAIGAVLVAALVLILLATVPHDRVGLGVTSDPTGAGTHVATDQTIPVQTSSTTRPASSATTHPATSRPPAPVVVTTTTATTVVEQPTPTTTAEPPITTPSTVLDSIYKAALTPCTPAACQPAVSPDLYRPIVLPVVTAGQPCPVSTTYRTVTKDLNPVFGDDPVTVLGISSSGAVIYVNTISDLPYPDRRTNPYWGGQYMGFASAPHTGVALVRGRQLDGDAPMGFNAPDPHQAEGLSPYDEAHVDANTGTEWELSGKPGFRFKRPGCYGLQIDTSAGTSLIIFRAVGPVMVGG